MAVTASADAIWKDMQSRGVEFVLDRLQLSGPARLADDEVELFGGLCL